MTQDQLRARAIALYDRFTHETHDRRMFMQELALLAGGSAAASALLASIAPDEAQAAVIASNDPRLTARELSWPVARGRTMKGYTARPAGAAVKRPGVIVIHENRGLNDHIRDVTRRVALAGYIVVAPDFLSPLGGTPLGDEDRARDMIGKLDLAQSAADGVATARWLSRVAQSNGKVGAVGFCWGGAMVNRLAVAGGSALKAGVAYYGPAPDPAQAAQVKAAMMLHYAGLDERVNASGRPWFDALRAAGVRTEGFIYANANHAFNNDTSKERYDKTTADLAWSRTLGFFKTHLG